MENHHLCRPQALECSLAGPSNETIASEHKSRVSEVLEGGRVGEVLITNVKVSYVSYLSQHC